MNETQLLALEPPESLHFKGAEGWLELGDHVEANEELQKINGRLRAHPDVLELRWRIFTAAKKREVCLDIADALTRLAPQRSIGWLHLSATLHQLGRTKEAWNTLSPLAVLFPCDAVLPYQLACYACRLGNISEAVDRLREALRLEEMSDKYSPLGNRSKLRLMALRNPDLEQLWVRIGDL